ncbi:SAM-dependent methyltransferase [Ideonella livida]|nr:cyclopropane-fatty-acyl-phospholipid synthase family protein [Ideonella livida]
MPTVLNPAHAALALPAGTPATARTLLSLLARLQVGSLDLQAPDGTQLHFAGAQPGPRAALRLKDWGVCVDVLRHGDVGFGEAYMAGRWSSPDLAALLRVALANRTVLERAVYGSPWAGLLHRLRHWLNRNSKRGSRRNIQAHYDLGNPFYRLWLDPSMNYSSAWFQGDLGQPLQQAQEAKMRRALDECRLQPGQRVLEIGCGWGAVAECATRDRGLHLTGLTLSTEQLAFAQERLARQGLAAQADLRLQDYRDIPEQGFDGLVSIEMFEAVGEAYWPGYFATLQRCLKPGGRACIQSITLREDLFDRYRRSTDFIQQYVFPGGMLPTPTAFEAAARRAGLRLERSLAFGPDYAETLRRWRHAFLTQEAQVRQQGYDERFLRLWEFYLAYCEAAFDEGSCNVMQFTLVRD